VHFAFPTQTLHIESMAAPEPAAVRSPKDRETLLATLEAFGPGGDKAPPEGQPLSSHGFFPGAAARAGSEDAEGEADG
ncbi:MAG: hypothetical protein GXP55_12470, partial [Deltaproteobacteria bacterium]|nr:hypothetical protein [Deltaproteobacteria bacterium]